MCVCVYANFLLYICWQLFVYLSFLAFECVPIFSPPLHLCVSSIQLSTCLCFLTSLVCLPHVYPYVCVLSSLCIQNIKLQILTKMVSLIVVVLLKTLFLYLTSLPSHFIHRRRRMMMMMKRMIPSGKKGVMMMMMMMMITKPSQNLE